MSALVRLYVGEKVTIFLTPTETKKDETKLKVILSIRGCKDELVKTKKDLQNATLTAKKVKEKKLQKKNEKNAASFYSIMIRKHFATTSVMKD